MIRHPRYVRSNSYDPNWVVENQMGPNALGLTEALTEIMPIEPGMKVLDLGCGKAMSSIFLAREFRVSVWATDLWIPATTRELGDEIPTALEPHWVGLLLLALTGLVADPLDQDPQSRGR